MTAVPRRRRRYGFRTYLELSAGAFIITVFYYIFNKLLDMVYGKYDVGLEIGITIIVLIFIVGFASRICGRNTLRGLRRDGFVATPFRTSRTSHVLLPPSLQG